MPEQNALWAESIVSGKSFEPCVHIKYNDMPIGQFTPDEAREFAGHILAAAEAAESDAFIFHWLTRDLLQTTEERKEDWEKIIGEFRKFREARSQNGQKKP